MTGGRRDDDAGGGDGDGDADADANANADDERDGRAGAAPATGKVDRDFFDEVIYPNLGADREDVRLGPTHGVDFGVLDVGGRAVVLATDPLSILPGLGFERAGRFAIDVVLADVAVSGVAPTHLTVGFTLPPELGDREFAAAWRGLTGRARELGVRVATGHTARYDGIAFPWVGAATAVGVGDHDDVVRPDGARPGDALVISTGPAAEVAGLFATLFGDRLGLDDATLATARDRLADVETVRDARAAVEAGRAGAGVTAPDDPGERAGVTAPDDPGERAGVTAPDDPGEGAGVTAMHDATECGIQGALVEMARGAGVRFDVERAAVPVADGVAAVCAALDVEPWHVTSSGTLVIAVAPDAAARVVEALRARDTPAAVVGSVAAGEGVYVDGERVAHPETDPSWAAFAALYDEGTPSK